MTRRLPPRRLGARMPEAPGLWTAARHAPLTAASLAACILATGALHASPESGRLVRAWLLASPAELAAGRVWALWTSAFLHADIIHLGFNGFWLWDLGRRLEHELGSARWLALTVSAAVVSSLAQLMWSGAMGIGYSGVVYALAGFAFAAPARRVPFSQALVRHNWALLVGWAAVCVGFEIAGTWNVANGAHLGGLAFGWLLGKALGVSSRRRS
jgi:membrane associated rhomboid family serine protease